MTNLHHAIDMLEDERKEIAFNREQIEFQAARLNYDLQDLSIRDRMLVSAISTIHEVAARRLGKAAVASEPAPEPEQQEASPSPQPSPARGEGEGAARRLDDLGSVQDGRKMSTDGQASGSGSRPLQSESAREVQGDPPQQSLTAGETAPISLPAADDGAADAESGAEDVDAGDAPGHDAAARPDAVTLGRRLLDDINTGRATRDVAAKPTAASVSQGAGISKPKAASPLPVVALPPSERMVWPDTKPAPAVSIEIAGSKAQQLADQIEKVIDLLMEVYPGGPTAKDLTRHFGAPDPRVRDAVQRLTKKRFASFRLGTDGLLRLIPAEAQTT